MLLLALAMAQATVAEPASSEEISQETRQLVARSSCSLNMLGTSISPPFSGSDASWQSVVGKLLMLAKHKLEKAQTEEERVAYQAHVEAAEKCFALGANVTTYNPAPEKRSDTPNQATTQPAS
jgi:hypothetical protein